MPPKSYVKFKDAYYDDIIDPMKDDSESSVDSFIAEEDEDSEGSNPSEVSKGSSQSNEKYPESSVARGGKRVSQAERNRASVLEKLKQSREKAKRSQAKTRNKTLYKASAKVNRGINFEETIEEGDNDVNSGDSDGTISPSKKSVADRKRNLSRIESSEEDDEILSPSKKTRSQFSRIESSPDSAF